MQAIQMTGKEADMFFRTSGEDGLSDLDYAFNPETEKFDIPTIEWDGWMGKHVQRFDSEEARTEALNDYQAYMNAWVLKHREELKQANISKQKEAKRMREINTLGIQFPVLKELLYQM